MAKAKKKENMTPEERLQAALVPDWEQPYKVPENWCWVKVGEFSTLYRGVSYKKQDVHTEKQCQDYLILRGGNILEGAIDTERNDNVYVNQNLVQDEQLVQPYDIIIVSSTGSSKVIGRAGISYEKYNDVAFGAFLTLVRPNNGVVKPFIAYYFQSSLYRDRIRNLASGVNINNIKASYITESPLPLPPLTEQQRIVDRIESLFAKLDKAKQKAQDAQDSFESRKAAILHKAFSGELTAQWRKEQGVEIESWRRKKYSEICDIVRGGSPRPAGSPEFYGGNIPFMKVADITRNIGPYVNSTEYTIKEAGLKKTRMVDGNTLLLTNSGATLGVPAICTFKTTFNDGIAAFLGLNCDTLLFHYYFWTSKTEDLRAIKKGAAQPNLNTDIIGNVEINLPTEQEQIEIIRILDELFAKEQQAKEAAEAVLEQIDFIKKSILARAFRGELRTNSPDEESSIGLLKRNFLETIKSEKIKPKQVTKQKKEVVFMPKTIMGALSKGVRLTPENLKSETQLPIDDFYAQLKELFDNGCVVESRENGESYLEAVNENRQTES